MTTPKPSPHDPKDFESDARHCPVHNEPEPREFWISSPDDSPIFETFVANVDPAVMSEDDNYMDVKSEKSIHVIEHSAYAALKAENEKMNLELAASRRGYDMAFNDRQDWFNEADKQAKRAKSLEARILELEKALGVARGAVQGFLNNYSMPRPDDGRFKAYCAACDCVDSIDKVLSGGKGE